MKWSQRIWTSIGSSSIHGLTFWAAVFCLNAATVLADAPSVAYIFPAGGQRGQTVKVRIGGHYLHGDCPWQILGDGIEAPPTLRRADSITWFEGPVIPLPDSQRKEDYPWEHVGNVTIASDAPVGLRRWRVWTSQGVTPTMKFVVGDLPELVEDEVAGEPIPTLVTLPLTINGRIFPREDVDVWTFDAQAGTSYVCEVMAARLGSPLDSRLEIRDPNGQTIAENVDSRGHDSFVQFTAMASGRYQVRIHDVNFDGLQHFVYRLTVTDQPFVQRVYPLGGQRGMETAFTLFGQALPEQPVASTLPQDSVLPWRHRFTIDGTLTNPVVLDIGTAPELLEVEPNDTAAQAPLCEIPIVLNGRIDQAGDVDSWQFEARQGDPLEFEVRAARLGSPLDSAIAVYDASGKELGSNDDGGKANADSRLVLKIPADGRYRVAIKDRFAARGGGDFAYRLYVAPAKTVTPGFDMSLPTDGLTLLRGAETKLKFTAVRRGEFDGPITIQFDGLPAGVEVTGNEMAAQKNDAQVAFKVAADAVVGMQPVRVVGVARVGEADIRQPVVQAPSSPGDVEVDHLAVAIAMPTPFKVIGLFETRYADRGSTFTRHYSLDRGGYAGPIQVRLAERQVRHLQGVTGDVVEVPAGKDEFYYRIKLPPWMEIGRTSRTCVMAVAEVTDEAGKPHTVSYTSHAQNDQVILLVDPGQLDLKLASQSLAAHPGMDHALRVGVARGSNITGDVLLELVTPAHLHGVTAQPVVVSADQPHGTLQLKFASEDFGPCNEPLIIRATAHRAGGPYTAERTLAIVPLSATP